MENYQTEQAYKGKRRGFRIIATGLGMFMLLSLSFGFGVYVTARSDVVRQFAAEELVYLGQLTGKYSTPKEGVLAQDVDFSLFWDVWDMVREKYVDQDNLNDKVMFYGAIKGMVAALGDPYTVFMDPKISTEFAEDLTGTFEGIGAEIGIKNEILTVIAPLPEMPAEKAGLKSGDKIMAIDGEPSIDMTVDEAVSKIRGPKGTAVKLLIAREGGEPPAEVEIVRNKIMVKSVRTETTDDDLFVIKIINFNDDTIASLNDAIRRISEISPRGLVLDLRNNPGGYLDTAIEVSSEWIEDGVIVTEKYSDERKIEHLARGRARLKDFRTVVLVNEGSASASEITAGALRDYGQAIIVGKTTFGKGSVQSLDEFGDGSSLKVTVAKWLTPNGTSINDEGIRPDVEIELTAEDYNADRDPQMDKAVAILLGEAEVTPLSATTSVLSE